MTKSGSRTGVPVSKMSRRSRRRATLCQLLCAPDSLATTAVAGIRICDACAERLRAIAASAGVTEGVP